MLLSTLITPLDLASEIISYVRHPSNKTNPLYPVSLLRVVADRAPTYTLSCVLHGQINFYGDLLSWNRRLREDWKRKREHEAAVKRLLQQLNEVSRELNHTTVGVILTFVQASTLREYEQVAEQLDRVQGNDEWKQRRETAESTYNPKILEDHLHELQVAKSTRDPDTIIRLLRTRLSRDLGGMSNLRLYKHSWIGTKRLIEDYNTAVVQAIETFLEVTAASDLSSVEANKYLTSLEDSLKFYGRSALLLSGGATSGMKHVGVIKSLFEVDLLPRIISGTSAGSIVAAIAAQATDDEMPSILEFFPRSNLAVFDPPGNGILYWMKQRILTYVRSSVWFDIAYLQKVMIGWLGDITFLEAYNKTGRVLNITVSGGGSTDAQLLNYITAPHVHIWSAVCASCSVPWVFTPQSIYEKDPMTKETVLWSKDSRALFMDGSLDHDLPMRRLSEMYNVNFGLVSQVNPHVRLFLLAEEVFTGRQPQANPPGPSLLRKVMRLIQQELVHRAQQAADLGLPEYLYRWVAILNQQYTGDLNILPEIHLNDIQAMMANPTPTFMRSAMSDGERAIWPKMSRIRNSVQIELALVRAIYELRDLANFNPDARASRRAAGESLRGRSRSILRHHRGRSLSNVRNEEGEDHLKSSGPPSPAAPDMLRRSQSAASLIERLGFTPFTPLRDRQMSSSPETSRSGEEVNPYEQTLVLGSSTSSELSTSLSGSE